MHYRGGRFVFVAIVCVAAVFLSYRWVTNPEPRAERALQESAVIAAREAIISLVAVDSIEIVDPLATNRKIGKAYIYRNGDKGDDAGWAVSGFYRRDENDNWHPYLMMLSSELAVEHLKVGDSDKGMIERAENDPEFEASP